jgi:hypothetical protein
MIQYVRTRGAHGIGPRRPAQRPWLAEGISRSTWYRRGNRILLIGKLKSGTMTDLKSKNFLNMAPGNFRVSLNLKNANLAHLSRAKAFAVALRRNLDRCVLAHAAVARELAGAYV